MKNAGSERQVRRAARSQQDRDERFRLGLHAVMSTPDGRACIWGLLGEANVYASVWSEHGARMAFNAGKQDFGHWLLAECLEVSEDLYQTMEREGRAWQRRDDRADAQAEARDNEEDSDVT